MDGPRPAHHLTSDQMVWFDFDPAWLVALAKHNADKVPAGLAEQFAACSRAAWRCDTYLMLREAELTPGGDSLFIEAGDGEYFVVDLYGDGSPRGVELYDQLPCRSDDDEGWFTSGWAAMAALGVGAAIFRRGWAALRHLLPGRRPFAPDSELTPFERKVLAMILAPSHPSMDALRAQLDAVRVTSRKFTGAGFYTDLVVAADVPSVPIGGTITLTDLHAYRAGEPLLGFVLWVRDGRLHCLECFDYVSPWPEDFETLDLVAGHAGGNVPADIETIEAACARAR